jgi:hypothetical protein
VREGDWREGGREGGMEGERDGWMEREEWRWKGGGSRREGEE